MKNKNIVSGFDVRHKKIYPVNTRLGSIHEYGKTKTNWLVDTMLDIKIIIWLVGTMLGIKNMVSGYDVGHKKIII